MGFMCRANHNAQTQADLLSECLFLMKAVFEVKRLEDGSIRCKRLSNMFRRTNSYHLKCELAISRYYNVFKNHYRPLIQDLNDLKHRISGDKKLDNSRTYRILNLKCDLAKAYTIRLNLCYDKAVHYASMIISLSHLIYRNMNALRVCNSRVKRIIGQK